MINLPSLNHSSDKSIAAKLEQQTKLQKISVLVGSLLCALGIVLVAVFSNSILNIFGGLFLSIGASLLITALISIIFTRSIKKQSQGYHTTTPRQETLPQRPMIPVQSRSQTKPQKSRPIGAVNKLENLARV